MDALNALLMISLNGPHPGTPEANELIKHVSHTYSESRQYKKTPVSRVSVAGVQTIHSATQTIYIESEAVLEAEANLDSINLEKYPITNFTSESECESSDDELEEL